MKTLSKYVTEAMSQMINESSNDAILASDHYSPNTLYYITGDIERVEELLSDSDFNYTQVSTKSKLAAISWNDESIYISDVPGNNLADAKKRDLENIQAQLDKQVGKNYVYLESDIFGSANEWSGKDIKNCTANTYLNRFIKMIKNSYVDGDSNSACALVDLKSQKVLIGGSCDVVFIDAGEFTDMFN